MSEPEHFLARWARRKREAVDAGKDAAPEAQKTEQTNDSAAEQSQTTAVAAPESAPEAASAAPELAHLPSIEEITADTDIRAFLAPGVPTELKRAALRRAWSADPAIRDFVGLAENTWDFNNPDSISGFGRLEMTPALRREVARLLGDVLSGDERADTAAADSHEQPAEDAAQIEGAAPEPAPASASTDREDTGAGPPSLADERHVAAQNDATHAALRTDDEPENLPLPARRHGGALPQ
jgi:hypothetical protein